MNLSIKVASVEVEKLARLTLEEQSNVNPQRVAAQSAASRKTTGHYGIQNSHLTLLKIEKYTRSYLL